jgi:hypothetical protein
MAYPAMLGFLPTGWLGLMLAGLLAAYVSTMTTHLNWGTSYLVHDLYRRFLRPGRGDAHYVRVGRLTTALLMLAAASVTFVLESARETFELLMSVGAGTGLLYLLRWYWWRINAWSEIAAMVSSFVVAVAFTVARRAGAAIPAHVSLLITVAVTTIAWVSVTFLAPPADDATLIGFYRKVGPAGPGWRHIRELAKNARSIDGEEPAAPSDPLGHAAIGWVLGCTFVYAALFGVGSFIFGHTTQALVWLVVGVASGIGLARVMRFDGSQRDR